MRTKLIALICSLLSFYLELRAQAPCTLPLQLFTQDTLVICKDTSFRITINQFPLTSYQWSTGESDTSIVITQSGKYWVNLNSPACSISDTLSILFNSLILEPQADSTILCLNAPGTPLRASGLNLKWYDTLPIGGMARSDPPVPSTSQLGEKIYYVSQTILGCESPRAAVLVEVIDKPGFELGDNILIPCGANGISLQVIEEKYTSYVWGNGTTGPVYDATKAGTYTLTGNNICGSKVDTVIAVDCDTRCVHFPSAFTPNGDGLNDFFRATAFCPVDKFRLVIANRFGEIMFETRNPKDQWDGRWMGKPQVAGTYVFYSQYYDFVLKRDLFFKGSFQLIK